ncbi:hypothetical protein PFICI_00950 [Pestalotiopsis fici W106-1]|uniref:Carbohydrate esterase family 16 protein n=1 Tax=Pestalotiopsis fici (strain W106-1 / CGMCC3.15140) TaxID=1229662 RepID=W3XNN3_PESFW|nr:uncharacterized protein PFICI_00950 [Pestalotiopsis fici W106-1]ETS87122.1 hypothetical protein PFICI_00950 [Pestalotiopsis fici W106-1]
MQLHLQVCRFTAYALTLLLLAEVTQVHAEFACFNKLQKLFVFGDSYSRISFNATGPQPSVSNPYGNNGSTSANGPNWVNYITGTYNESLILTYDFALSGAVVNNSIVSSNTRPDLVNEFKVNFVGAYGNASGLFNPERSIFAFWFGINDVNISYNSRGRDTYAEIMASYHELVLQLYGIGARNFLFLYVPPLQRAPVIASGSNASTNIPLMETAVREFNSRIYNMTQTLQTELSDATVFLHDSYATFDKVIDNPGSSQETALLRDTKNYCTSYAG